MSGLLRRLFNGILAVPSAVTPAFIKRRADPERFTIDRFIREVVTPTLKHDELLLDAGAGKQQFKTLLSRAKYQSTDYDDPTYKVPQGTHDFYCSLDAIPQPDYTYDVVVNTQVLEHVDDPQKVINEFYRVLKPGGRLYLTTNQMFPLHYSPYNYFFFTVLGLELLFKRAGFEHITVTPRGGIFFVLAKIFHTMPAYLFYQIAFTGYKRYPGFVPKIRSYPALVLLLAPYLLFQLVVGWWLPFILFYCDRLDRQQHFTLGHACICIKGK